MYTVIIESSFKAWHAVKMPNNSIEDSHWHNWRLKTSLSKSSLDEFGFAIEFGECEKIINLAISKLAEKNMNTLDYFASIYPTTELVAKYIFEQINSKLPFQDVLLDYVELTEQENCRIKYSPQD